MACWCNGSTPPSVGGDPGSNPGRVRKVRHPLGVRITAGIGHMFRPLRHPPCRGRPSRAWWRTGGQCPSPPAPAEGVQRVIGRANRDHRGRAGHDGIGGWCNLAARRSLEPYVAGSSPAPPANRSRMRIRSGELSVVEGSRDRVLAAADPWMVFRPALRPYEAGAYGRTMADGLIAVRQGCSSIGRALADAGSSPAAPRAGLGAGSSRSY